MFKFVYKLEGSRIQNFKMFSLPSKKNSKIACGATFAIAFVIMGLCVINVVTYILSEFIFCINTAGQEVGQANISSVIPKKIHQVFFVVNGGGLPEKYLEAQQTWINRNPGYEYTLWNASMIAALIDREYPEIKPLYHSYKHWIQHLNVAKYVVLHYYGGIYADLDVWCKDTHSMDSMLSQVDNKGMVVSWSTGRGMASDLMAASPHHPFVTHLIRGLEHANRWFIIPYLNTMASTGTLYLLGRYYNYIRKDEIFVFPSSRRAEFIGNLHWSSWHRWDGVIIWWSYNHPLPVFVLAAFVLIILLRICIVIVRRQNEKHVV